MKTYPFSFDGEKTDTFPKDGEGFMLKRNNSLIEFDLGILKEYNPELDKDQLISLALSVALSIVSLERFLK